MLAVMVSAYGQETRLQSEAGLTSHGGRRKVFATVYGDSAKNIPDLKFQNPRNAIQLLARFGDN